MSQYILQPPRHIFENFDEFCFFVTVRQERIHLCFGHGADTYSFPLNELHVRQLQILLSRALSKRIYSSDKIHEDTSR